MDNKASTTKQYADSTYLAKSGFTKEAIANLLFPSGFEFITTSASFNPNTAWGGTWTKETLTVVQSSSVSNDGNYFAFEAPGTGDTTVKLDGAQGLVYCNGGYRKYKSGLKINSTTKSLYKWIKKS